MAVRDDNNRVSDSERKAVRREIKAKHKQDNPDPITGAPGSHPTGTGLGAAAGATAGAAIGSVVPGAGSIIGAAIGVIVGAIGGGYAGKGLAEYIDPTAEDAYWRAELQNRPYYDKDYDYDVDYGPAYGYGYASRAESESDHFGSVEDTLGQGWDKVKGKSRLNWEQARGAVSDAWKRWDELKRQHARRNPK